MLLAFFAEHWEEILLSLVTAGALAFCRQQWNEKKNYQALLDEKNAEALEEQIDEKIAPIVEEVEKLREYIRKVDVTENHKMELIIDSYKFRLVQLCKLYIKQKGMTQSQYDQLSEFYKLYTGLGGNGQAKEYYERVIKLPIIDMTENKEKNI